MYDTSEDSGLAGANGTFERATGKGLTELWRALKAGRDLI